MERIERHRHQNNVIEAGRRLRVEQDLIVFHGVKFQVLVDLQGPVLSANTVQLRQVRLDVAWRVPISFFELVFFRIEILFAIWNRHFLANLESAVDPVDRAEGAGQYRSDQKCRTASSLQKDRQYIWSVSKE